MADNDNLEYCSGPEDSEEFKWISKHEAIKNLSSKSYVRSSPKLQDVRGARTPPQLRTWSRATSHYTPSRKKEEKQKKDKKKDVLDEQEFLPHLTERQREDDNRKRITYSEFATSLGECIQNSGEVTAAGDVTIDENCLQTFKVMCMKQRCREYNRWLLNDNDTYYENMCSEEVKYTHTCQYEQRSSISLQKHSGHNIGLRVSLGGGFGVANAGVGVGYGYGKGKNVAEYNNEVKLKTSTIEINVKPLTAVVAKELTFIVKKTASCEVELYLKKNDEIKYSKIGAEEQNKMNIEDLWKNGLKKFEWAKEDGDHIVCFLATMCYFTVTEIRIETFELDSDLNRCLRIIKWCTHGKTSDSEDNFADGK